MSITQTYQLAHTARAKLSFEASQQDHHLRLLVGHANMLDSLMLELADVEREQEQWFNQSVRGAASSSCHSQPARRIQWADRVLVEDYESSMDDDESDEDDSDDDFDEADFEMTVSSSTSPCSMRVPLTLDKGDDDDDDDDGLRDDLEDDYALLELVRTPSRSNSPPELIDPDSDTSDDDVMPPSPADDDLPFAIDKEESATDDDLYPQDYYVSRPSPSGRLVSAISVY
ncbi:hypothetical protein L249_7167 [Ophiocordyceps polyrhachis-furcata BCC 54312]|uniref:Uncharacterized protein n=1 Tax=Ophiocordyceps polyrhachis-furcata BCC 54312 TaxID=1330021 RepID=A0A367LAX4_9HYPO|nr:hypothetical protein L249_7167 [Ophiocordyceps polyrhachis-furcata BCC 54312]